MYKMNRAKLFISLVAPYWRSKEGLKGWGLLALTFALTSLSTYSSIYFTEWNGAFYNALESREYDKIMHEIYRFIYILSAMSLITVNQSYFLRLLKLNWREWMTRTYTKQWLSENRFYHINKDKEIDNIDQRISDDIASFIGQTTSIFFGLTDAAMTIGGFTVVLWNLSGTLDFSLGGHDFSITGYLVYGAFTYAVIGFLAARVVGKRFKFLSWQGEKVEADYRRHVMTITEHDEAIAMANAGEKEQERLKGYFSEIYKNAKASMSLDRRFNIYTLIYGQGMFLPPLFLTLPKYLSGALDLGGFMQVRMSFSQVVGSLSWFTNSYDGLMAWFATMDRLTQIRAAIYKDNDKSLNLVDNEKEIVISDLTLKTPAGDHLLSINNLTISKGEHCYISAPSGTGKTSLIKALSGLWHHASGSIEAPKNITVISQRDYIPSLNLRDVISYPNTATADDIEIVKALSIVKLSHLAKSLDVEDNWQARLSGGERQRLKLAKCFITQAPWLILDEAFSAIDSATSDKIINDLFLRNPNTGIICITHDEKIKKRFERKLEIKG